MTTRLIIIRHCETTDNKKGKIQGYNEDSEFTEEGQKQLIKLINRFKEEHIDAVFCSDLGRAYKTAEAIAKSHGLITIKKKDLRECDIGDWSNLPVKEGIAKWIVYYEENKKKGLRREDIRPPNGENSFDHQKRVMNTVDEIISNFRDKNVVIVGHSGTNRVIMGSLENKDPDDFYTVGQSNACVNIIEYNGGKYKLIVINDVTHLKDETS